MTYINRLNQTGDALNDILNTATELKIGDSETLALMIGAMIVRAGKRNDDNMVKALEDAGVKMS